jgi:hypothetical protein
VIKLKKTIFILVLIFIIAAIALSIFFLSGLSEEDYQFLIFRGYTDDEIKNMNKNKREEILAGKFAIREGLTYSQHKTLFNLGYTDVEIMQLSQEEIDYIFAPGTHLDGAAFDGTPEQYNALKSIGIDNTMSNILFNLGFTYKEMLDLTTAQLNFIFPNTKLVHELLVLGISQEEIDKALSPETNMKLLLLKVFNEYAIK